MRHEFGLFTERIDMEKGDSETKNHHHIQYSPIRFLFFLCYSKENLYDLN